MTEIELIKEELNNFNKEYYSMSETIQFALYILVSEEKITQDTYDLLVSKFDILNRKYQHTYSIAHTQLVNKEKDDIRL